MKFQYKILELAQKKTIKKRFLKNFIEQIKVETKIQVGTGLGMSIVKKIVDIHKGKINIDSQEDIGTKITLSFPLQK